MDVPTSADHRCPCGRLIARLVEGGVEIKCTRCKRTHVLRLPGGGAREEA